MRHQSSVPRRRQPFRANTSADPTLMNVALAIFQADHIAQRMKQKSL
jgi:hypothetical protein